MWRCVSFFFFLVFSAAVVRRFPFSPVNFDFSWFFFSFRAFLASQVPAAASYSAPAPAGAQYAAPSANVGGPPPGPPPPLQQAPQLIQAIVLAPYQARSATELSISAGEHVTILEDAPSGWTKALNAAGVSGWVPATYLKR